MKNIILIILLLGVFLRTSGDALAQEISVSVNPAVIKNEDFGQLLGGYINTRDNLDPSSKITLSTDAFITEARKALPQAPEFTTPVVMRTQSAMMLSNDYFALTEAEVEDVINFCSRAGCDPMFGAFGEGATQTIEGMTGKIFDTSETALRRRVNFVKEKCQQYFNDARHCQHWDIGNEPPSVPQSCDQYGAAIPGAIRVIKEIMPGAIIHTPELYLDSALVRDSTETIGECIARKVNEAGGNYKIDVFTTHWYEYVCLANLPSAGYVDGNAVLKWDGFGGPDYEKMSYPLSIMQNFNSWKGRYGTTANAKVGIGELNPMGACAESSLDGANITKTVNQTWGAAFWYLDVLGIAAESGIAYSQKHTFLGRQAEYSSLAFTGSGTNLGLTKLPPYFAYQFLSRFFGKRVVDSFSNNPAVVNSHAALDKDGNLRLLLINKSGSGEKPFGGQTAATSKRVHIQAGTRAVSGQSELYKMRLPGNFSSGGAISESELFRTETVSVSNDFFYTIEPYTAVIIKIPLTPENTGGGGGNNLSGGNFGISGFFLWRNEFLGLLTTKQADYNDNGRVDIFDFFIWRRNFLSR